jgi:predicted O-methyltransferase YrrM
MLEPINQIQRKLHRMTYRVFSTPKELTRLRGSDGAMGAAMADAMRGSMQRDLTPEERRCVEEIEGLRGEMLASSQPIEILHFGSGGQQGTAEEMIAGKVVRTQLGTVCRGASKFGNEALLMMKLVRALRPEVILELGTCLGISAAYQAAALKMNGLGRLLTLEGAPALAAIAEGNLRRLNLSQHAEVIVGRFAETLPQVLQRSGRIDLAFIDGHHDYAATLEYFEQIKPQLRPTSVVIFDDIAWSAGMAAAWKQIVADPDVRIAVDLFSMGLCTLTGPKQNFRIAVA